MLDAGGGFVILEFGGNKFSPGEMAVRNTPVCTVIVRWAGEVDRVLRADSQVDDRPGR